jgi:hypothetical protein
MTENAQKQFAGRFLAGFSAVVCTLMIATHVGAQEVGMPEIVAAMERRQEHVRSAKFVWTETRAYPKGSIEDPDTGERFPPKDTTVQWNVTLCLDGSKLNYTFEGELWDLPERRFVPQTFVTATDGVTSKSLMIFHPTQKAYGTVHDDAEFTELRSADVKPILVSFRAQHELYGSRRFVADQWSLLSQRQRVDGLECVVVRKGGEKGIATCMAFAPAQDLSLVQYSIYDKTQLAVRIHITHRKDAAHGWVPATWDITSIGPDGKLDWLIRATVTEYSVNESIDPKTFAIEFPVNSVVREVESGDHYVVLEGGRRGPLGLGPDEDLTTGVFWRWVAWSCGALTLLLLWIFIVRRRRASAQQ